MGSDEVEVLNGVEKGGVRGKGKVGVGECG